MQKHWRNWLVTKMSITTSLVTIAGEEGKDQLTTYNSPKCCTGSGFHVSVCNSRCSLLRWDEPWTQGWGGLGSVSGSVSPLRLRGQYWPLIGPHWSRDLDTGLWLAAGLLRLCWAGTQCTCDTGAPAPPSPESLGPPDVGQSRGDNMLSVSGPLIGQQCAGPASDWPMWTAGLQGQRWKQENLNVVRCWELITTRNYKHHNTPII